VCSSFAKDQFKRNRGTLFDIVHEKHYTSAAKQYFIKSKHKYFFTFVNSSSSSAEA